MSFDAEAPMTTTSHSAALLTSASALAMYDAAESTADKLRAAAAMAELLRRAPVAKPKKPKAGPSDILSAETLAAALKRACAVVERRNSIPILSCVLLESTGGSLTLTATDLDVLYVEKLHLPGGGLPVFRMAVSAADLAAAVRGAKGEVVFRDDTIVPEPGAMTEHAGHKPDPENPGRTSYQTWKEPTEPELRLAVIAGGAEVRLAGLPHGDFPVMKTPHREDQPLKPATATMPAADFLGPLTFVRCAVSAEEGRYYLNGVYMHDVVDMGLRRLTFAATDGSRLLLDKAETQTPFEGTMPGVIIPRKMVEWLTRNVVADEIQIDVWQQAIRVTWATGELLSKVIDGNFPDYARVLPKDGHKTILGFTDAKDFEATLRRLAAATKEKRCPLVLLTIKGDDVLAQVKNMDGGTASAALDMTAAKGDAKKISFNARYFADILAAGANDGTVDIGAEYDPVKFLWPSMPSRTGVLMPLRT